jgi:hypothetical protein
MRPDSVIDDASLKLGAIEATGRGIQQDDPDLLLYQAIGHYCSTGEMLQ